MKKNRGSKMEEKPQIKLFYTKDHKESELALNFLKAEKIHFSAIDVEKCNIVHTLERDIGTVKIPTIVSSNGTFIGLDHIKTYIEKK